MYDFLTEKKNFLYRFEFMDQFQRNQEMIYLKKAEFVLNRTNPNENNKSECCVYLGKYTFFFYVLLLLRSFWFLYPSDFLFICKKACRWG